MMGPDNHSGQLPHALILEPSSICIITPFSNDSFTVDKTIPHGDILPSTTILSFIVSRKGAMLTCTPGKKSILPGSVNIQSPA